MKKLRFKTILATVSMLALTSYSSPVVTNAWEVDFDNNAPIVLNVWRGDIRALTAQTGLTSLTNDAMFYWQSADMQSLWYSTNATVAASGDVSVTWDSGMDAGDPYYTFFVRAGGVYCPRGTIRMQGSPGATPNDLPLPVLRIDFDLVQALNAPWTTPADVDAATSGVLRAEADTLATVTARGGVTTNSVTIDPGDLYTNKFGGKLTILGQSVKSGSGTEAMFYSHAEGGGSFAFGMYSHAEGEQSRATGQGSHSAGYKGIASELYSWTWQGVFPAGSYNSHGDGTFNVNPVGGPYGFWIGDQTLPDFVDSVKAIHTDIATNVVYHVVVSNGHWLIMEAQ